MLHDCEGGYEGSIPWFELGRSSVSAHYVVREDGSEATQMVDPRRQCLARCTFNRRSVGVEMGGFASRGFDAPLIATTACALASDRALPRAMISAPRAAVITICLTTQLHAEIYWPG